MEVSKYLQLQQSALRFPFLLSFVLAGNCNNQYNKKHQMNTKLQTHEPIIFLLNSTWNSNISRKNENETIKNRKPES